MPTHSAATANVVLVTALVGSLASDAAAQAGYAVSTFGSRSALFPGEPLLLGGSFTSYTAAALGIRIGGAAGTSAWGTSPADTASRRTGAWIADADLVLAPGRGIPELGALLGGFVPAAFVGFGWQTVRDTAGAVRASPVLSYGVTVERALLGPIAIETEARYRRPAMQTGESSPAAFPRGWEYRAGLTLHFGSRGGARAPRSRGASGSRTSSRTRTGGAGRPRVSVSRVLATAERHVGTRYTYGGTDPRGGFDCSGFVQYVFREHGVNLPRTSRQMASAGDALLPHVAALRPGDLMLFARDGRRIDHVAIYAGGNRIIHSSSSGRGVRYDDLSTSRGRWFVDHLVAARRVVEDGHSLVQQLEMTGRIAQVLDPPDAAPAPR